MKNLNIRSLLDRLGSQTINYLNNAAGLAVSMTCREVTVEHFLVKTLEDSSSDVALMVGALGEDDIGSNLISALTGDVTRFKTGAVGRPVLSPLLVELLQESFLWASLEDGADCVRSGHIFTVLVGRSGRFMVGQTSELLAQISDDELAKAFAAIKKYSNENPPESSVDKKLPSNTASGGGFVERFGEDFTQKAKDGLIDPVFGREAEIRQIINILLRRRKNNPILVGDPGVGKTALVEGLALKIANGEVPDSLKNTRLIGLDMGRLEAGAGIKGEFENRLKGVIDELKASASPVILFIDEAHTVIGAGGAQGSTDAANLLKPALARGELRTCAATTWKEYKKYFEKDAALARRFQPVSLDEPNVEQTAVILRGLRGFYEKAHQVIISDAAIERAADYSERYITGRFQPDKAVDLIDTACARVKSSQAIEPGELEDLKARAAAMQRTIDSLRRDLDQGLVVETKKLKEFTDQKLKIDQEILELDQRWRTEKELIERLIALRGEIFVDTGAQPVQTPGQAASPGAPGQVTRAVEPLESGEQSTQAQASPNPNPAFEPAPVNSLSLNDDSIIGPEATTKDSQRAEYDSIRAQLAALQGDDPLIHAEVGPEAVARIVSEWTGIPLGRLAERKVTDAAGLAAELEKRVHGQNPAIMVLARELTLAKAGLNDPLRPLGVFLLVGPSGVGKTETAMALAESYFGDERALISINMSEFQEKHTVSRLIGSPPGYVGYGEGGLLTEAVRRRPYSVVLLDECDKAHEEVLNLFYQVFDRGMLTDSEGKTVSFSNTVLVLTSNLASEEIRRAVNCVTNWDLESVKTGIWPLLTQNLKPAFLSRLSIVPFGPLSEEALREIVSGKLAAIRDNLRKNSGLELVWTPEIESAVTERCLEAETGARNIDYVLKHNVLPALAKKVLELMGPQEGQLEPTRLSLQVDERGFCQAIWLEDSGDEIESKDSKEFTGLKAVPHNGEDAGLESESPDSGRPLESNFEPNPEAEKVESHVIAGRRGNTSRTGRKPSASNVAKAS
ncbi:MAG: type VI secretion system ATPase TssH [Deltaproteobacteria bacterium]|jgi:type VI secretion system protein VasG|nr:type VI secretion system ATPase TssH [Deltaproteobacteria bacterium]